MGNHTQKLVIIMHGLGDSNESFVPIAKEINLTGLSYLLINAPKEYYTGYSWYDIPPGNPRIGIDQSLVQLKLLLEEINDYGIKNEDIILFGFSQGGCMAIELANSISSPFCSIVALSPKFYFDSFKLKASIKDQRFFIGHGELDEVISFEDTRKGAELLKSFGSKVEFCHYKMGHEICIDEIIDIRKYLSNII